MHPDKHNNRPCATELFQDLNTKYANKCSDKDDKGEKGVEGDDTIKQDIELLSRIRREYCKYSILLELEGDHQSYIKSPFDPEEQKTVMIGIKTIFFTNSPFRNNFNIDIEYQFDKGDKQLVESSGMSIVRKVEDDSDLVENIVN